MESVSSIPTLFLVAAGIFIVSVALLVIVLWLGRRWLIGPLHRLSQEVEQLKEAERQPAAPPQAGIAQQEVSAIEASRPAEPELIGLSQNQDPESRMPPEARPEEAGKNAWLVSSESARNKKRSDSPPVTGIEDLSPDEIVEMYRLIHEQIKIGTGEDSLIVVLYDMQVDRIEIAYPTMETEPASNLAEDKRLWNVVHTGQALHEITRPGGSWLGVPIRTGNEVFGALVIENTQLATGFDENDQHLLSNLADQMAIVWHCQRLMTRTRLQAEQGQSLASLICKIWTSSDRDAILRTALEEIGQSLHASSGLIQLEYSGDAIIGQRS